MVKLGFMGWGKKMVRVNIWGEGKCVSNILLLWLCLTRVCKLTKGEVGRVWVLVIGPGHG